MPTAGASGTRSGAGQLVGHTDNVKALLMSEDGRYVSFGSWGDFRAFIDLRCRCCQAARIRRSSTYFTIIRGRRLIDIPFQDCGLSQRNDAFTRSLITRRQYGLWLLRTPISNVSSLEIEPGIFALLTSAASRPTGARANAHSLRGVNDGAANVRARKALCESSVLRTKWFGLQRRARISRGGRMFGDE